MSAEKETQTQTGIRLPDSLLERIDKIAEKMSQPGLRITRAEVIRLFVTQGADRAEQGEKANRTDRARRRGAP